MRNPLPSHASDSEPCRKFSELHADYQISQYLNMLHWSSQKNDEEAAHLFSGERAEMKWEKMDFAKAGGNILSRIHQETWGCDPAVDWSATEEIIAAERAATANGSLQEDYDRCKRDVFYLAGWFARGRRYWQWRGGDVDLDIAAVSFMSCPSSPLW